MDVLFQFTRVLCD